MPTSPTPTSTTPPSSTLTSPTPPSTALTSTTTMSWSKTPPLTGSTSSGLDSVVGDENGALREDGDQILRQARAHVLPFPLGDVAAESLDNDIDPALRASGNLVGEFLANPLKEVVPMHLHRNFRRIPTLEVDSADEHR